MERDRKDQEQDSGPERLRPTASWHLDYFKRPTYFYYVVSDENSKPLKTIKGQEARQLRRILSSQNEDISMEAVNAFGPLLADAFGREFDLSEEGEAYRLELVAKQPKKYSNEGEDEVYRRFWTGYLMPNGISAEEIAEKVVKAEPRVRLALAWGDVKEEEIKEKINQLASVIREYHPNGSKGK